MMKRFVSCIVLAACFAMVTGCSSNPSTPAKAPTGGGTSSPKEEKKMAPVETVGTPPPPPK